MSRRMWLRSEVTIQTHVIWEKVFFKNSNSEDIDPCNTEIKYIKKTLVNILPSHLQNGLQVLLDQCLKTWNIHKNNSVTLDKIFLKTQTWHILKVR